MQIRVRCNCGEANCDEWGIVELQGVVEPQPGFHDSLPNLEIGTLCRHSSQEVYTLTIGYHELTGSKVPVKKPMLVLKKVKHQDEGSGVQVELQVVGIIRHKILFKTRPKAIISSCPTRNSLHLIHQGGGKKTDSWEPQVTSRERQKSIMLGSAPSNQAV